VRSALLGQAYSLHTLVRPIPIVRKWIGCCARMIGSRIRVRKIIVGGFETDVGVPIILWMLRRSVRPVGLELSADVAIPWSLAP